MNLEAHMLGLLSDIQDFQLDSDEGFKLATMKDYLAAYNGCGAEWQPAIIRDLLTLHFHMFEACFLIHDWDFKFLPKTEENFHLANKRLLENCRKIIRKDISMWRFIERHRRYVQAYEIYFACEQWGFGGFMAAKT